MTQTWTQEERREALDDLHRINPDAGMEPYNSVVSYNSDLIDLACERNHYAAIMLKLADNIKGFHEDGMRPDEWLLQDWERRLRAALDSCGK